MINLKKEDNLSNKADSDSDIPEALLPLSKYGDLKFKNNKIYFKPVTFQKFSSYIFEITIFIIAVINVLLNQNKAVYGNYLSLYIIFFTSIIIIIFLKNNLNFSNIVFDNEKDAFYSEIKFLGISIKYNYISKSKIVQISNNNIPSIISFSSDCQRTIKNYKETNLLTNHMYNSCVSLLSKNGKIINIIKLGHKQEFYENSLEIAKIISDYFKIPLFTCERNSTLNTIYNLRCEYELTYDSIQYASDYEKSFVISIYFVLPVFVAFILDTVIPLIGPIIIVFTYNNFIKL